MHTPAVVAQKRVFPLVPTASSRSCQIPFLLLTGSSRRDGNGRELDGQAERHTDVGETRGQTVCVCLLMLELLPLQVLLLSVLSLQYHPIGS
ncbi:unnamed protein product [Protopolystoma xenopodis]|uniref:Uncharacterized protein n=1 Tax=Protopolystoma xenopodis TaxID=117903 RepID=A0A3S5FD14_9PLAT|nr:unnamed protein product [Protopolystoma xenopodis]